jgi:tol-pal system protein YbgF
MRKLLPFLLLLISVPAIAQDSAGIADRMARLERDITFLQRQIYRGGASAAPGAAATPADDSQTLVQLTQIQEEMRALRGGLEQVQYSQSKLKSDLKSLSDDVDYRLRALEEAAATQASLAADDEKAVPEENPKDTDDDKKSEREKPSAKAEKPQFTDSDTHYNYAFGMLNKKQYDKAAASFDSFIRTYPKDPLVPNALYWQGESYYARGDYVRAADGFRRGYEAAPDGQKAPDNLLKLGLSLANVKRKDEACVVLGQVTSKYTQKSFAATRDRAEQAKARLKCSD